MIVTVIALKYVSLVSQWSYGHFLKLIQFHLNSTINVRHLTQRIISCYTHKTAIVSWPLTLWLHFNLCILKLTNRGSVELTWGEVAVYQYLVYSGGKLAKVISGLLILLSVNISLLKYFITKEVCVISCVQSRHCPHSRAAAITRHLPPTGPTAANL